MTKTITIKHCLTYHFKVKEGFDINDDNAITALLSNGTPTETKDDLPVEVQDKDKIRNFYYEG